MVCYFGTKFMTIMLTFICIETKHLHYPKYNPAFLPIPIYQLQFTYESQVWNVNHQFQEFDHREQHVPIGNQSEI